jgi:hypothetical protein
MKVTFDKRVLLSGIGIILLLAVSAPAQRIEAVVTTDLRTLPLDRQDKLRDFKEKVEHYLNAYDWTNDPWNTIVYVDIQIILEDMSTSAEERYKGQIVVSNKYDMQLSDKRWRFAYQSTDILNHDENVMNSFTSMLDYFIYLILGMEFDKWSSLGGSEYFNKAKNIAEQSKFGLGRFIEGWDRRLEQVTYLTSDQHLPFREMVDYYFYGLSLVKEDNVKARQFISQAVEMLDKIISKDPDNEYAKMFLNAHYIEMVEVFRRAQDKTPLRTLMVIDPTHAQVYKNILEK